MSFYSILPSNSCPMTQPDNKANSYIVDWQSPIQLPGNWKVALTEYTICSFPDVVPYPFSIDYKILHKLKGIFTFEITEGTIKTINTTGTEVNNISFKILADNKFEIKVDKGSFEVCFTSITDAHKFGFNTINNISADGKLVSNYPINLKEKYMVYVPIFFDYMIEHTKSVKFNEYIIPSNSEAFIKYFNKYCSFLFEIFNIDQNGFLDIVLKKNIIEVIFNGYIINYFGFEYNTFTYVDTHKSTKKPIYSKSFNHVYIYSNVIEPILVGGVSAPLLRNILVESTSNVKLVMHENIINPMYLPVSSSSINNIEVEIRDDSGELINFPYGSKNSITLHFIKDE
jgi:hypothetical protein